MKISFSQFMGEIPRIADQLLPENAAAVATNCRFLSGNLESWMNYVSTVGIVKAATINTIYLMDDQYWLHWRNAELGSGQISVDVARSPIADDERTIFTGTDVPRQTNITLAIDGDTPPGPYPINSYKLGVPAPDDTPLLTINSNSEEGEINLENIDADDGDTSGFTLSGDVPDMQVFEASDPIIDPPVGYNFFFGGPLAAANGETSIATYNVADISAVGITPGMEWRFHWQDSSGASASTLTVEVVWYDDTSTEIERATKGPVNPPNGVWTNRQLKDMVVPAGAAEMDIIYTFTNAGGGATDVYIAAATFTVANASVGYDGSSLSDWSVATAGGGSVAVDATFGYPAPSFKFTGAGSEFATIYRNFLLDTTTSYTLDFDILLDNDDSHFVLYLGATATGASQGLYITDERVAIASTSTWTSIASTTETLATGSWGSDKVHVSLTVEKTSNSEVTVNMLITDETLEATLFNGSRNMTISGGYLGFGHYGDQSNDDDFWVDNIIANFVYASSNPEESATFTQYVYTYVNGFGEEGPPSELSRLIQFPGDGSVTVATDTTTTPGSVEADYWIVAKRIYRAVTAGGTTSFLFVTEIPLATAEYTDSLDDDQLGEELETVDWDLPPEDGFSVIALPNGVTMMASGSELAPSVTNHSHAYPLAYRLKFASDIVAIAPIDTSVIVGTTTYPYLVVGSDPSQMSAAKFEQRQACVSKRSMVTIKNFGVVYASPDGLVAINATGSLTMLTEQFFTRKEWQAIQPETMIGLVHDDKYFGATDTGYAFMFDPHQGGNGWVQISANPICGFSDPVTDTLYYVQGGEIRAWDSHATDKLTFAWTSKILQLPRDADFTACQIKADDYTGLELRVYADGAAITWPDTGLNYRVVANEKEFVLPMYKYRYVQIKLNGTGVVKNVELAEDMEELT